jgi:hypothetical protein
MKRIIYWFCLLPTIAFGQVYIQQNAGLHLQKGSVISAEGAFESLSDVSGDGTIHASGKGVFTLGMNGYSLSNLSIEVPRAYLLSNLNVAGTLQLHGNIVCNDADLILTDQASITTSGTFGIHTNGAGQIIKTIRSRLKNFYVPAGNGSELMPMTFTTNEAPREATIFLRANEKEAKYWTIRTQGLSRPLEVHAWFPPSSGANDEEISAFYRHSPAAGWSKGSFANIVSPGQMKANISDAYTDITVMSSPGLKSISLYPNPVKKLAVVEVNANKAERTLYSIVDISGRIVATKSVQLQPGLNRFELALSALTPGVYNFRLLTGGSQLTKRIVKL